MFIYEKVVEGVRHLFQATGVVPAAADTQLSYVDDDGSAITVDPVSGKYFDDGHGGIVDAEGSKVVVKAGDTVLIPKGYVIPTIQSIAITKAPTKVAYTEGDKLSMAGIEVTATYTDSSTAKIRKKELTFSPAEGTVLAKTDASVTVTYQEKTATQAITVAEKPAAEE